MSSEVIVALCALVGTMFGSLAGILSANRLFTFRIEQLERKVDKHNNLIERMTVVERDQAACFRLLDDQKTRISALEG